MKRTNSDYPRREEDDKQYKSLRGADLSPSNSTGSEGVPEITSTRVADQECTDETPQVQEDAAPQDEQSTQDDDSSITQPIPGSPEVIPCTQDEQSTQDDDSSITQPIPGSPEVIPCTQDDDRSITQPIPGSPEVIPCTQKVIPRTQDEVILLANVFM